jgi:hypothetical protein
VEWGQMVADGVLVALPGPRCDARSASDGPPSRSHRVQPVVKGLPDGVTAIAA